jgi:LacI family transcriptional regulator
MMNPLFHQMARGAEVAAQAAGMTVFLGNSDDDPALEARYIQTMAEHRVDGIILIATPASTADGIPTLPPTVPLVHLDRRPADLTSPLISCNTRDATCDLVRHLISLGHQRIAIVGGMPEVATWRNRLGGYLQAQREAGRPESEAIIVPGDYRSESGAVATRQLLSSLQPPDAIIAASALVLHGVLDELEIEGKSVPQDISVGCVDDPFLPSFIRPKFTYVEQPGYDMGAAAVAMLLASMGPDAGSANLGDRELMASLVIGESCGETLDRCAKSFSVIQ